MGIGGKDTHELPSAMFRAQVSCTGCHTHVTPEGEIMAEQEKKEASRQSCVKCHGEGYDLMFDNWLSGQKKTVNDFSQFMKNAKADFRTIGGSKKKRTAVQTVLTDLQDDFTLIKEGHMVHNIQYSINLLNKGADKFENAMKDIKKSYTEPSRGEGLQADKTCQIFCHGKTLFPEKVKYEGSELPHKMHVEEMELSCASCHSLTKHGETKINDSVCSECH